MSGTENNETLKYGPHDGYNDGHDIPFQAPRAAVDFFSNTNSRRPEQAASMAVTTQTERSGDEARKVVGGW